jgi:hypothetical protein
VTAVGIEAAHDGRWVALGISDLTFLPIMVVALDELALPHELDPDGLQGVEAAKLFASALRWREWRRRRRSAARFFLTGHFLDTDQFISS